MQRLGQTRCAIGVHSDAINELNSFHSTVKMLRREWLLILLIAGATTAMIPVSREKMEESLTGALDAITRRQRSLDAASQDYYNDLRPYKYHDGDTDRKLDREQQLEREIDPEDEQIEFLPNGRYRCSNGVSVSLNCPCPLQKPGSSKRRGTAIRTSTTSCARER